MRTIVLVGLVAVLGCGDEATLGGPAKRTEGEACAKPEDCAIGLTCAPWRVCTTPGTIDSRADVYLDSGEDVTPDAAGADSASDASSETTSDEDVVSEVSALDAEDADPDLDSIEVSDSEANPDSVEDPDDVPEDAGCTSDDACNDGNPCTKDGICVGGACVGVLPVLCTPLDECHDVGTCDPATGACTTPAKDNGEACDDEDACTESDVCEAGSCQGTPRICVDGEVCTKDACESSTGCIYSYNTAPCDDEDPCTSEDACDEGSCVGKQPTSCNDGNPCTKDMCDEALGCQHENNTASCSDGNACTQNDVCSGGACSGVTVSCDDGDACNGAEWCDKVSGCVAGTAPSCDDGVACTADSCSPIFGCKHTTDDTGCDDGEFCNGAEKCDPVKGCSPDPVPNGTTCNDEDSCTSQDACFDSVCIGQSITCDDGNVCTVDLCDSQKGCQFQPVTTPKICDDENACTTADTCQAGFCVGGAAVNCVDGNLCTDDSCDPEQGCVNVPSPICESPTAAGDLVITEIMYRPASGEAAQWFEIANLTQKILELKGCVISDFWGYSNAGTLLTGSHMIASPVVLLPSGVAVFASPKLAPFTPTYTYPSFPSFGPNGQPGSLNLDEVADNVTIKCGGIVIDVVAYEGKAPWPVADGATSIQLKPSAVMPPNMPHVANDIGGNWVASNSELMGVPKTLGTPFKLVTEDADCQPQLPWGDACNGEGKCTAQDGVCVVGSDADCQQSYTCTTSGRCTAVSGKCIATSNEDCKKATHCENYGYCTAADGYCKPVFDSDCQQSKLCKEQGKCVVYKGQCEL